MIGRRTFVKLLTSLAGSLAFLWDSLLARAEIGPQTSGIRTKEEVKVRTQKDPQAGRLARPQRTIEREQCDLVVVGGGLSGICAAISAARNGVKTALVHDRPMLGGHSSSEVRLSPEFNNWFCPWARETGIIESLYAEDRRRNHEPLMEGVANVHWDLVLYEAVLREENIRLYLNTSMHKVVMRNDSRIDAIEAIQLGTEKDVRLSGELFVDATGIGTLGYLAGSDHYWGREGESAFGESLQPSEPDENTMGNTMYFRARDVHREILFQPPGWVVPYHSEESLGRMRGHQWIEAGYYWLEVGSPYHIIHDNEAIRHEQLRHVLGTWDHIKNWGDHGAEKYALEWVGWVPYRRDGRRLRGDYILTQRDIQQAPLFEDRVAYGAWPIDIHTIGGIRKAPESTLDLDLLSEGVNPYSIPYRSLYSRTIENLFMCGRNISCTWVAFASTRILPTGAMTGEAVGVAASLCHKYRALPRAVTSNHMQELQQTLLKQDHFIPQVVNEDPDDLGRAATVTASSEAPMVLPLGETAEDMSFPLAQLFPVSESRIDRIELWLESGQHSPTRVRLGLRAASTVWDFSSEEDLAVAEAEVPPRHRGWVAFDLKTAVVPGRLYYVHLEPARGIRWKTFVESENIYGSLITGRKKGWWEIMKGLTPVASQVPVGTVAAKRMDLLRGKHFGGRRWNPLFPFGRVFPRYFAVKLTPPCFPYAPANVTNGVARPETWTNIWISDPEEDFPQWIELEWPRVVAFDSVYLTFDTNLNRMPEFPQYVAPECVKDYTLSCWTARGWKAVADVKNNYHRHRIHRFTRVEADRLRVTVGATNGAPSARVYEIRIYNEQ